jgi:hypothetical protein
MGRLTGYRWLSLSARLGVGIAGLSACTSGLQADVATNRRWVTAKDTRILHEDCPLDGSGAESQDVNGDGRADRTVVRSGGVERCRGLDLNFDGTIDAWVYLEPDGKVRRRESDYDRDGRIDEVALYSRGALVERQRATSLMGKLDTWQFYEGDKVVRAERDSNGDDVIDQWWEYPSGRSADCPLIHSDVDGDGRPDPGATVDVCGERHDPGTRDGSNRAPAPGIEGASDIPTEVETPGGNESPEPPAETPPADGESPGEGGEQP